MMGLWWRLALFVVLWQAVWASLAEEPDELIPDTRADDEQHAVPGIAHYLEAVEILSSIKTPQRKLARFSRPSGILGMTTYYAKGAFNLLFMNGPRSDQRPAMGASLNKAVALLESSAQDGNEDAGLALAEMSFFGAYGHTRNYSLAFARYKKLADTHGNSEAQHMVGFFYATGIGKAAEPDQARALLYHSFAADAGDARAQMTAAYRYHSGIGTKYDCEKAVLYYRSVADKAMEYAKSGPPGGQQMVKEAYRLADETGGVYGDGASVVSSGDNAKRVAPTQDTGAAFDDVLEYLDLMSRKGELKAIFSLGRLHYDGSRALQRNYRVAAEKFFDVARRYWDTQGRVRQDTEPGVEKLASKAAGYLGRMFLRGEGLEQNFQIAKIWFKRGLDNGDALSQYSMGLIFLHGLGVAQDAVKAADYFGAAADQDFAVAQVRIGALLMDQGDLQSATKYFNHAARNGHIEAYYYLAELANMNVNGQNRNCHNAATFYKLVAEKAEPVHSNFGEANDAYEDGDLDTALLFYMMAAEQGYEVGQANVAYLLDRTFTHTSTLKQVLARVATLSPFSAKGMTSTIGDAALALIYWNRSARERNIDSMLKMGDYYLAGLGLPTRIESGSADRPGPSPSPKSGLYDPDNASKAAACYLAASETQQSAQALFNLGWMHENGIGLVQDFHLAKRYYDAAAEPPMREAQVPVALALIRLRVRSWWNWLVGGSVNSIRSSDGKKRKTRTFWEWFGEFLAADLEDYQLRDEQDMTAPARPDGDGREYTMDEWGNALHVAYGIDDEEWEDGLNDLVETLIIIAFAGLLAGLVWYRQMVAVRQRAEEEQRNRRPVLNLPEDVVVHGPLHLPEDLLRPSPDEREERQEHAN